LVIFYVFNVIYCVRLGILFEKEYAILEMNLGIKYRNIINDMPRFLAEKTDDWALLEHMLSWLDVKKLVSASMAMKHIMDVKKTSEPEGVAHDLLKRMAIVKSFDPGQPIAYAGEHPKSLWLIGMHH
jgi:hypothetical protein